MTVFNQKSISPGRYRCVVRPDLLQKRFINNIFSVSYSSFQVNNISTNICFTRKNMCTKWSNKSLYCKFLLLPGKLLWREKFYELFFLLFLFYYIVAVFALRTFRNIFLPLSVKMDDSECGERWRFRKVGKFEFLPHFSKKNSQKKESQISTVAKRGSNYKTIKLQDFSLQNHSQSPQFSFLHRQTNLRNFMYLAIARITFLFVLFVFLLRLEISKINGRVSVG